MSRERTSFLGPRMPAEIKHLSKTLKKLDLDTFSDLVSVAVSMLTVDNPQNDFFSSLTEKYSEELIENVYPGILTIIHKALRIPSNMLKKKQFIEDLTETNIPTKYHPCLMEVIFGEKRNELESHINDEQSGLPTVDSFRWRVDVNISNSSLKRVMEPSVLCNIRTTDNSDHTFQVSKEKFHELRYAVSEVLNNMQQLEKRSILKIDT